MKVSYLGPGAYAGRVERAGWPVPPELCDREIASASLNAVLNQFQLADELGFDWISVSEHHYAPGLMTPNPVVLAAAASQRTKNVKIALLGPLMPLANPVRVAEEIAMLDSISGGRTVVLPLRGTPNEHATYTKDGKAGETRGMTQEGVSLMIKAWTEPKPFSWRGTHFEFEHVSVWPRCIQEPHPPVFYSGNSDESIDFAAKHRLNLAMGFAPVGVVTGHIARYREQAKAAGWEPQDGNILYRARVLVTEDDEQAASIVKPPPHGDGQGGGAPGVAGYQFYGAPETILRQIDAYHRAGVGILDLAFSGEAFGRGGTRKAMEVFAPILPRIHEIGAGAVA